ncbi:MAG: NUDIX hydrolase [Casimicrobiaceae bacterium]|nr:NUDIX hydrolase [Casimicrobiaceae bacterium]MCX8099100.1 NUDIX hydrolase [Casimicrobiaceae bacterium]MDW8312364.1 NUDIX hydrolase [Burkholderiales bacterium]
MKFCSQCGSGRVALRVPEGDHRERWVCADCGAIHYSNPRVVCGVVARWDGRILLARRGIEPRYGQWTLPAGFMENGETLEEGAMRELWEETRARVRLGPLVAVISVPHIDQVHMMFLGDLIEPVWQPTPESIEVALFAPEEIPWDRLAFRTVRLTLEHLRSEATASIPRQLVATIR